jgi:hypothetical protein
MPDNATHTRAIANVTASCFCEKLPERVYSVSICPLSFRIANGVTRINRLISIKYVYVANDLDELVIR